MFSGTCRAELTVTEQLKQHCLLLTIGNQYVQNEVFHKYSRISYSQPKFLEEECVVRGRTVIKDGENMETYDETGMSCNKLGQKRNNRGSPKKDFVSTLYEKRKGATKELNVLASV